MEDPSGAYAIIDGQKYIPMETLDGLEIHSSVKLLIVERPDRDYWDILRTKMKWGV